MPREAKTPSIRASDGYSLASVSSIAVKVAAPPTSHSSAAARMRVSSGTPSREMSEREGGRLLRDLDAYFRGARHQSRGGMVLHQREQLAEARRPEESRAAGRVIQRAQALARGPVQAGAERVLLARRVALGEGAERGVADGAIARAAAEVAAQLVTELPRVAAVLAVVGFEERHHETGRTVAALGSVLPDHVRLHRVELCSRGRALQR